MSDVHLTGEQILDLGENRIGAEEAVRLEAHLAGCDSCRQRREEYRALLASLALGAGENAPEAWIRRAQNRELHPRPAGAPWIVFDSLVDALPGMRGPTGPGRQYVIEAGHIVIEVSIAAVGPDEPWPVSGQLLAREASLPPEIEVALIVGGTLVESVKSSPHGEFLFTRRPHGSFRLRLEGSQGTIETPDLAP